MNADKQVFRFPGGRSVRVEAGLRDSILSRASANPKPHWTDDDYVKGAALKNQRWKRRLASLEDLGLVLQDKRVLDVACGNALDCLMMATEPVKQVIGVDLRLSLFLTGKKGERHRKLARELLRLNGRETDLWHTLSSLPMTLVETSVTRTPFPADYFDLILSKSFLEHMIPIEAALLEMLRILAPGGHMYHVIDPYYWLRGCHAEGLIDIPWAHARLSENEYRHFVAATEGVEQAGQRLASLKTLNHFSPRQFRAVFDRLPVEIVHWEECRSTLASELLAKHPEVPEELPAELCQDDLLCNQIKVLVRKPDDGQPLPGNP